MKPLHTREITWGQFRLDANSGSLEASRPILVWGRDVEDLCDGLFGVFYKEVPCAEMSRVHPEWIAVITDPEPQGAKIAALCYTVKQAKRRAATLIPVPADFCADRPTFPFTSNAVVHLRIRDAA